MSKFDGELKEFIDRDAGEYLPVLIYDKTLKVSSEKLNLFRQSCSGGAPIVGSRPSYKWFPVAKIASPQFTIESYNTKGQLRPLKLEVWLCLDKNEDGLHSVLPMLIDNHGKEKSGTGSAVWGTDPSQRIYLWPLNENTFTFFYGGTRINFHLKEK